MKHKKLSQKWQGICEYKYSLRQTHKKTKTGEAKILHKANSPWQEIAFLFHYCMSVLPNIYKFRGHLDIKSNKISQILKKINLSWLHICEKKYTHSVLCSQGDKWLRTLASWNTQHTCGPRSSGWELLLKSMLKGYLFCCRARPFTFFLHDLFWQGCQIYDPQNFTNIWFLHLILKIWA